MKRKKFSVLLLYLLSWLVLERGGATSHRNGLGLGPRPTCLGLDAELLIGSGYHLPLTVFFHHLS